MTAGLPKGENMKIELYRLELILNLNLLTEVKEKLKIDLMDPMLSWIEKMELYQCVLSINKRIDILIQRLEKRPSA